MALFYALTAYAVPATASEADGGGIGISNWNNIRRMMAYS